jgi:hypothetical protein
VAGLAGHYHLDAVRAHLLEMTRASIPERNYLLTKAARLAAKSGSKA